MGLFRCLLIGFGILPGVISASVLAADKLVILSSQRKDMQTEILSGFKESYQKTVGRPVEVDWIDVGGPFESVKFLRSRFREAGKNVDIDILWGGGSEIFVELDRQKMLQPYQLPAHLKEAVPRQVGGVSLFSADATWVAVAMTTFGLYVNTRDLAQQKLPVPRDWGDLLRPEYKGLIVLPDPRRSSGFTSLLWSLNELMGWEKAWEFYGELARQTRRFTNSSLDPIRAVESGEAPITLTLDFFAYASLMERGSDGREYILPPGKVIVDVDPVAMIQGAPHGDAAQRFITYLLSAEGQGKLAFRKGVAGGPKNAAFGRISVNKNIAGAPVSQRINPFQPFTIKHLEGFTSAESAVLKPVFSDVWGAVFVDGHKGLRPRQFIAKGEDKNKGATAPPITRAEMIAWSSQWGDGMFRQKKLLEIQKRLQNPSPQRSLK